MSERFKYALNGVYRCENFAQHLANDDFPAVPIGCARGCDGWVIRLRTDSPNKRVVYLSVYWPYSRYEESRVKYVFCVLKKDGSASLLCEYSTHVKVRHEPRGCDMAIFDLLNEKNGYLNEGALVVEYGIQVESILGEDKIWRFNAFDQAFDCQEKKNMITFPCPSTLEEWDYHGHKLLLAFHSSYFCKKFEHDKEICVELITNNAHFEDLEYFLQISQGVQLMRSEDWTYDVGRIMILANYYSFLNVIRYCERQLIENDLKLNRWKSWIIYWDRLRHYLVHLLKDVKSPREVIKKKDIKKMPGETMKMFVAKFLYNKF